MEDAQAEDHVEGLAELLQLERVQPTVRDRAFRRR